MLTYYQKKKTFAEMEEEAIREHRPMIVTEMEGRKRAFFPENGSAVGFRDGRKYRVSEDGSLRRIKEKGK